MKRRRASSLLELLVAMGLMGLVLVGVATLIGRGVDYYLDSNDGIEVRQQLLFGSAWLSKELRDSSIDVVRVEADGLVFPSTRGVDGSYQFDSAGRSLWQKYICYYVDDPNNPQRLLRKEVALTSPPHPPEQVNPPDPYNESPAYTPTWFRNNAAIPERVIVRNLVSFNATKEVDLVSYSMEASVSTRREHLIELQTRVNPRH